MTLMTVITNKVEGEHMLQNAANVLKQVPGTVDERRELRGASLADAVD